MWAVGLLVLRARGPLFADAPLDLRGIVLCGILFLRASKNQDNYCHALVTGQSVTKIIWNFKERQRKLRRKIVRTQRVSARQVDGTALNVNENNGGKHRRIGRLRRRQIQNLPNAACVCLYFFINVILE